MTDVFLGAALLLTLNLLLAPLVIWALVGWDDKRKNDGKRSQ